MSLVFVINNITINAEDVLEYPKTTETISLGTANAKLFPSELELKLDNISGEYDDRIATSIFFGVSWYNTLLTIYDTELKAYTWRGKVKSIDLDEASKVVTVKSSSIMQDVASTLLVYSSTTNITPAEHIYNILIDVVGVELTDLDASGFNQAIAIQSAASVYANINFTAADDKKCLSVINELCRMVQCELYTEDNKLKLKQYQVYDGQLGTLIDEHNLIADASYKHNFDEKNIANSYNIKYDNSGTIASATGSDSTSQAQFGERAFNIPNESLDTTTSSEYKILFKSSTAAEWAGALAIARFQSLIKYFEITTGPELDVVKLNNQVDLSFDGMSREPGLIIDKKFDTQSQRISFRGYYINTPYQHAVRDITPPETPAIIDAYSLPDGSVAIIFTQNFEADFVGYRLYFTTSAGEWIGESSDQGPSPADIKNPDTTPDGYNAFLITGLSLGTNYSFKLRAYDSSFNLSGCSNTSSTTPYNSGTENKYMLTGNISAGLTLDSTNPEGGSAIAGLPVYGTAVYGTDVFTYAAIYQGQFFNNSGLSKIAWRGYSEQGVLYYQYDQSDDGSTWDGWSTAADATGLKTQALSKDYARIRFLFGPIFWSDSDYIFITEVN